MSGKKCLNFRFIFSYILIPFTHTYRFHRYFCIPCIHFIVPICPMPCRICPLHTQEPFMSHIFLYAREAPLYHIYSLHTQELRDPLCRMYFIIHRASMLHIFLHTGEGSLYHIYSLRRMSLRLDFLMAIRVEPCFCPSSIFLSMLIGKGGVIW